MSQKNKQRARLKAARRVNRQSAANRQAKKDAANAYNQRTKRSGPSNNVRKFREDTAGRNARRQNSVEINKLRGRVGKVKRSIGSLKTKAVKQREDLAKQVSKGVRQAAGKFGPGMMLKGAGKSIPHLAAVMDVFKARPVAKATRDYGDQFKKKKK